MLLPGMTSRQGLLDQREAGSNFMGLSEACRQFAQQKQEARQVFGVTGLVELVAHERQSGVAIAALGGDQGIETGCPKPPQTYRVTVGMFQQIVAVTLRLPDRQPGKRSGTRSVLARCRR